MSSLILIDSLAYPQSVPAELRILTMPLLGQLALLLLPRRQRVRIALRLAYQDTRKISEEAIEAYASPVDTPGSRNALAQTAVEIASDKTAHRAAMYRAITAPTLILWGRQDRIVPLWVAERLHHDIPDSQLVVIDDCGHIHQEERPDETMSAILGFTETQGPRRASP